MEVNVTAGISNSVLPVKVFTDVFLCGIFTHRIPSHITHKCSTSTQHAKPRNTHTRVFMLTLGTLDAGQTGCGCAPPANQSTPPPPQVDITSSFCSFHTQSCGLRAAGGTSQDPSSETPRRKTSAVRLVLLLHADRSAPTLPRERIVVFYNPCFICESHLPRPSLCPLRRPPQSHTLGVKHSCSHSVTRVGQRSFTSSTREIHTEV